MLSDNRVDINCLSWLEKSTGPLISTTASGCRACENSDDFEWIFFLLSYMPIFFAMQGKCLFEDISSSDTKRRKK